MRGLLVQDQERRSAENLAEAIEGATPRALQRFLSESPWSMADSTCRAAGPMIGRAVSGPASLTPLTIKVRRSWAWRCWPRHAKLTTCRGRG